MRSFASGLHDRNPLVLVTAAFLLFPVLLGIQSFFTSGAWTTIPLKYWIRNSGDDYMVASWRTADLKRDPPKLPLVVLVGGSSAREALWSGAGLAADVRAVGGPRIVASDLGSHGERVGHYVAIIDNVPNTPTTVLLGVNFGAFKGTPESSLDQLKADQFPLASETLREFAVAHYAAHYGKYKHFYTILPGVFSTLVMAARARGAEYLLGDTKQTTYDERAFDKYSKTMSPAHEARYFKHWMSLSYQPLLQNLDFNADLLAVAVKRGQERGLNIVLVDLPYNRWIVNSQYRKGRALYQARVRAIAAKYKVPYIDFTDQLGLHNSDFLDLNHLRPSGRTIWQARLGKELAKLYRSGVIRGGSS